MSGAPKGNVLFITLDQWRGDCLSAAGHPVLRTPILDRLAADGVLFTKHYTQASPCGPARASLYTGMYLQNHRSGRNGVPLDARHTNIALEARKVGYEPVLFGYTDTAPDPRGRDPQDPALDHYEGVLPGMVEQLRLHDDLGPWLADLKRKGHPLPKVGDRHLDIYTPVSDYPPASPRRPTRPRTAMPPS
jgi:arylsulfatase A-like enzyme